MSSHSLSVPLSTHYVPLCYHTSQKAKQSVLYFLQIFCLPSNVSFFPCSWSQPIRLLFYYFQSNVMELISAACLQWWSEVVTCTPCHVLRPFLPSKVLFSDASVFTRSGNGKIINIRVDLINTEGSISTAIESCVCHSIILTFTLSIHRWFSSMSPCPLPRFTAHPSPPVKVFPSGFISLIWII